MADDSAVLEGQRIYSLLTGDANKAALEKIHDKVKTQNGDAAKIEVPTVSSEKLTIEPVEIVQQAAAGTPPDPNAPPTKEERYQLTLSSDKTQSSVSFQLPNKDSYDKAMDVLQKQGYEAFKVYLASSPGFVFQNFQLPGNTAFQIRTDPSGAKSVIALNGNDPATRAASEVEGASATQSDDGRTLTVTIPGQQPVNLPAPLGLSIRASQSGSLDPKNESALAQARSGNLAGLTLDSHLSAVIGGMLSLNPNVTTQTSGDGKVTFSDSAALRTFLNVLPATVTTLGLNNGSLNEQMVNLTADWMTANTGRQFQEIDLVNNQIGDVGVQRLVEALKKHPEIARLDLHQNNIGLLGTQALADLLEENKNLVIRLDGNPLNDEAMHTLQPYMNRVALGGASPIWHPTSAPAAAPVVAQVTPPAPGQPAAAGSPATQQQTVSPPATATAPAPPASPAVPAQTAAAPAPPAARSSHQNDTADEADEPDEPDEPEDVPAPAPRQAANTRRPGTAPAPAERAAQANTPIVASQPHHGNLLDLRTYTAKLGVGTESFPHTPPATEAPQMSATPITPGNTASFTSGSYRYNIDRGAEGYTMSYSDGSGHIGSFKPTSLEGMGVWFRSNKGNLDDDPVTKLDAVTYVDQKLGCGGKLNELAEVPITKANPVAEADQRTFWQRVKDTEKDWMKNHAPTPAKTFSAPNG